jgi:hypothetical protein
MLKPTTADTAGRHGVDRVFFWIERDRPGVYARWFLDNEQSIVIPPGGPLDTLLCPEAFKLMMNQHISLQRSISDDVRRYLVRLAQQGVIIVGGLTLCDWLADFCADCLIG